MCRLSAMVAALALTAAFPVYAVTVTTLFGTGVDGAGIATSGNGADLHWVQSGGGAYTGASNDTFPIGPWMTETSTSRWLTPTPDAADVYDFSDRIYTFTEAFSLAGYDPATAAFSGRFADDNNVDEIMLNGTALTGSGGNFVSWNSFDSTGGNFVAGLNTLTFVVRNFGTGNGDRNPAGLRVEIDGNADAVPEAPVWALLIAGFGMIGFAMRRRSAMVVA